MGAGLRSGRWQLVAMVGVPGAYHPDVAVRIAIEHNKMQIKQHSRWLSLPSC